MMLTSDEFEELESSLDVCELMDEDRGYLSRKQIDWLFDALVFYYKYQNKNR